MKIETPYLLFLGSATDHLTVKIANSIVDWRPDLCVGETALPDCTITKGLPRLWPAEAREHGARTLVVCANNEGGHFEPEWIPVIVEALEAGLDVASGLHERLADIPEVAAVARERGRQLIDVRHTDEKLPTGTGRKRSGNRLLTVGTECSVGKMYTALAIEKEMLARGMDARFVATGQCGILVSGSGIAIDGAGFLMNNEMDDFNGKPSKPNQFGLLGTEANSIQPGKRMLSSMTPAIILRMVDFPAPFSPTSACTSPLRILKSTRSSAFTPGNDFDIRLTSRHILFSLVILC